MSYNERDLGSWWVPEVPDKPKNLGKAALILSFLFVCGICWIASIVVAIRALVKTRRTGLDHGRKLAIIALVIDGVYLVVVIAAIVLTVHARADRDADGHVTDSGSSDVFALRTGDCLAPGHLEDGVLADVKVTPCSTEHGGEVFAVVPIPGEDYPGDDEVEKQAEALCSAEIDKYVVAPGVDSDQVGWSYLYPVGQQGWNRSTDVDCIATLDGSATTGHILVLDDGAGPSA